MKIEGELRVRELKKLNRSLQEVVAECLRGRAPRRSLAEFEVVSEMLQFIFFQHIYYIFNTTKSYKRSHQ